MHKSILKSLKTRLKTPPPNFAQYKKGEGTTPPPKFCTTFFFAPNSVSDQKNCKNFGGEGVIPSPKKLWEFFFSA